MSEKAAGAFRTIGELSQEIGVRQHILRYWETRFPQLKPLQRAGGRRYYRPEDIALVRRIHALLNHDGYTIRGVQTLLNKERSGRAAPPNATAPAHDAPAQAAAARGVVPTIDIATLIDLRDRLAHALVANG